MPVEDGGRDGQANGQEDDDAHRGHRGVPEEGKACVSQTQPGYGGKGYGSCRPEDGVDGAGGDGEQVALDDRETRVEEDVEPAPPGERSAVGVGSHQTLNTVVQVVAEVGQVGGLKGVKQRVNESSDHQDSGKQSKQIP